MFRASLLLLAVSTHSAIIKKDLTMYLSDRIPNLDFNVESGYVEIQGSENQMYYQLTYKRKTIDAHDYQAPFVLWLNGGPGCSSLNQLYQDIGPINVEDTTNGFKLSVRVGHETSWNQYANILFIDQPFGVGYSYSSKITVKTTDQAVTYLVEFLREFYGQNPQFQDSPFYIFGVSYAGHFIPALGRALFTQLADLKLKYQGMGLGDPWNSPFDQIPHYDSFLFSAGLIDDNRAKQIKGMQNIAVQQLLNNDYSGAAFTMTQLEANMKVVTGGVDVFNYQQYNDGSQPIASFVAFLNDPDFKKLNGVPLAKIFQLCTPQVQQQFFGDGSTSRRSDIEFLLTKGKVLIYNGQNDVIVNSASVQHLVNALEWDGKIGYQKQTKKLLKLNEKVVGWYKDYQQFTLASIYNAGHLVPYSQPEAALRVFKQFLEK